MATMPSTFGTDEEVDYMYYSDEVPVESGPIDDIDNLPLFTDEGEAVDNLTLSSNDDYYDYDLNDYDTSGYVKPHLRGDTIFPSIRDVSKLLWFLSFEGEF